MPTSRMILGADGHGNTGLFATRPGFDALTALPSEEGKWSFRSDWPRVEKLHQVGVIPSLQAMKPGNSGPDLNAVLFPPLPYLPIVQVRLMSGSAILDDDWGKIESPGTDPYSSTFHVWILSDRFWVTWSPGYGSDGSQIDIFPNGSKACYMIWKRPAFTP